MLARPLRNTHLGGLCHTVSDCEFSGEAALESGWLRWEDDPSCYLLLQLLSVFGEAGWQALLVLPYLSILIELSYVGYDQ